MGRLEVAVSLDGWQIECCAEPPGPGDRISWPLLWADDPAGPGSMRIDWDAEALDASTWNEPGDLLLRHGPLAAYWRGPEPPVALGCLVADVHGGVPEHVPPVQGTVVSVDVVEQAYRLVGARTYAAIAGDFRLRQVPRSPKWFGSGVEDPTRLPELSREDNAVLVRLAVDAAILGT